MKNTYLFAGVSIFLWSSMATVSKLLLGTMNHYQVLFVSALFAGLALLVVNLLSGGVKRMKGYRWKDYLIMAIIGLPGTFLYYVFYYAGTARMLASQAFIINYLWPIMSVLFACVLLKEKMTLRKAVAIVMSFLGVMIVAWEGLTQLRLDMLMGAVLCALAAVSYGVFTALNQKWHYDKQISMMVSFFATFVLTFPLLAFSQPASMGLGQILGLAWNGVGVMAVATTTWALALDSGKTAKVSNLAYITPFLSMIWTYLLLGEPIEPMSVLGLSVIVLGIFVQLHEKKA